MLHEWRIDPAQYRRHEARRGRRHAFERLEPARTALVVIDLVPFFVDENPYAAGVVANVNRLADALRRAGGIVAWVVPADVPPPPLHVEFFGEAVASIYATSGGSGHVRERLAASLDPQDGDLYVEKSAASAFFPGRCPLHEHLGERGVENVIVVGTLANVCCESTVRDANTLGYRPLMVADANAAVSDEDLNATLHTVYRSFGDVRPTDEVIALLQS
ncbi:MAG: isochorismatase family cysteine hydrolase [Actinomycetota bacterium]